MLKKALIYSFSSRYLSLILQVATTVILARLLTPEDIGIYTIAAVFIGLAQLFRDFGVSDYLIKEEEMDTNKASAAFFCSCIISWSIGLVLFVVSPWFAAYYGESQLQSIIQILVLNFVLIPFGAISMTLHRRDMNFKPAFVTNVSCVIVNSITSIMLATAGLGAYSLAWASVSGVVTTVLCMLWYRHPMYKLKFDFGKVLEVFRFGAAVGGTRIIAYFGSNFVDLFIGKQFGMLPLGLFSRAKSTIALFSKTLLDAVRPVIAPYLSNIKRNKGDLATPYLNATQYVAYLAFPFCAVVSIGAEDILLFMYGEQWVGAANFIIYIALAYAAFTMTIFSEQIIIALDKAKMFSQLYITLTFIKVGGVIAFSYWGIEAILSYLIFVDIVRYIWVSQILKSTLALSRRKYLSAFIKPVLLTFVVLAGGLPYFQLRGESLLNNIFLLMITLPVMLITLYCLEKKAIMSLWQQHVKNKVK
jgi:O-antigen/teichoic acid export membrane protein